jgi:hypothetical protein
MLLGQGCGHGRKSTPFLERHRFDDSHQQGGKLSVLLL